MAGKENHEIYCWEIKWGELKIFLASSEKGALRVGLSRNKRLGCISYFKKLFPTKSLRVDGKKNRPLARAIKAVMDNRPVPDGLPLDLGRATPFQRDVWKALSKIPYGKTRTYGEIARIIGRPKAARAVGQAVGSNPLPLFFP